MTKKPKYGMWSNTAYMMKSALDCCPGVLSLGVLEIFLVVAANLLELTVTPLVLQNIEQKAAIGRLLGVIGMFMAALMLVKALLAYVQCNVMFPRIETRMGLLFQMDEKYSRTSYSNLDQQEFVKRGEKAANTVRNNHEASEAVWGTLAVIAESILGFMIYLVLLSSVDPVIVFVTLLTSVTGFFLGKRINSWGYRHREEEAEYLRKMMYISKQSEETEFLKDIRLFGMQTWLMDLYDKWCGMFYRFHIRAEKKYLWGNVLDILFAFLRNGIAYVYLIHMVLDHHLSAAQFLLYFTAVGGFTEWVSKILSQVSVLHKQSMDISAFREFLEMPEPFSFQDGSPLAAGAAEKYELELREVAYRYPGAGKNTLDRINLTLHPGEKLAVVGVNGAGKTTLVKILCGFYDPTEGQVLLNGTDIRKYNREDYYRLFAAVFQDFSLLSSTIAENVAQETGNLDRDKVKSCLRKAGLEEAVEALPKGMDSYLGKKVYDDGVEMSGGQLQRLMLARALYKDAPLLILDEPTAALDPMAENDIYMRYNQLAEGKSGVFISHRLASTRFCDRIILIEDGMIQEEGTHEDLLAQEGRYKELFEVQRKYYRTEGAGGNDESR